ncbi:MAG: hypothetical protein ACM32I_03440 [Nitrospirota bacterium]|jgi:hypothetical protein
MEAAGRAERELGAEIRVIKKTSSEYRMEKDPPPCPSVMVNGQFIAKKENVKFEAIKAAIVKENGR